MKLIEKPIRTLPKDLPSMSDRVEYLRCVLGYPIRVFTTKVGADPSALKKVLEGEKDPTMSLVTNILNIFPVNEEWLYLGAGEPFKIDDISDFIFGAESSDDGIDNEVNERFREIRLGLGLSQPVFASKLGITKDIVASIETKRSGVSVTILKKLAKEFSISELWLLYGAGNKTKRIRAFNEKGG